LRRPLFVVLLGKFALPAIEALGDLLLEVPVELAEDREDVLLLLSGVMNHGFLENLHLGPEIRILSLHVGEFLQERLDDLVLLVSFQDQPFGGLVVLELVSAALRRLDDGDDDFRIRRLLGIQRRDGNGSRLRPDPFIQGEPADVLPHPLDQLAHPVHVHGLHQVGCGPDGDRLLEIGGLAGRRQ